RRAPAPTEAIEATTILVVRAKPSRLELVASAVKPFACPSDSGDLLWRVEDAASGALLAAGSTAAPLLCRCDGRHDARGCVAPKHEAVLRVKVPHRAARERVLFHDLAGRELAAFELGSAP